MGYAHGKRWADGNVLIATNIWVNLNLVQRIVGRK